MGNPIAESWIYATILVQNEHGGKGTGFLVRRPVDENRAKIFLVTNKHVIGEGPEVRAATKKIGLNINVKDKDSNIRGELVVLELPNGRDPWREHPDRDVDVLALDVTSVLLDYPHIVTKWAEYSLFASPQRLDELDVNIGDDVMVVGYPLGTRHHETNFPLVRSGVLATRIGESLEDEVKEPSGVKRKRILRGFLVDGATIPGSSGSPVVLKPVFGRKVKDHIEGSLPAPILLGLIAEARYAPVQRDAGDSWSFAGLGLAFDAETVKETIELFFK